MRRHVDVLLPVSSAVRDLCRVGTDELHRVIPNFIRELPPVPPDAEARLAALPREQFILYFGDVTIDFDWFPGPRTSLLQAPPARVVRLKTSTTVN